MAVPAAPPAPSKEGRPPMYYLALDERQKDAVATAFWENPRKPEAGIKGKPGAANLDLKRVRVYLDVRSTGGSLEDYDAQERRLLDVAISKAKLTFDDPPPGMIDFYQGRRLRPAAPRPAAAPPPAPPAAEASIPAWPVAASPARVPEPVPNAPSVAPPPDPPGPSATDGVMGRDASQRPAMTPPDRLAAEPVEEPVQAEKGPTTPERRPERRVRLSMPGPLREWKPESNGHGTNGHSAFKRLMDFSEDELLKHLAFADPEELRSWAQAFDDCDRFVSKVGPLLIVAKMAQRTDDRRAKRDISISLFDQVV